jgi:4-diphosphocytidyl-2-C-methyl-D-erythritol kinase
MTSPSSWPAPAKLNLFLHVTGRRADGYHELQTVFQLLDHGDEVHLALRRDGRIQRRKPTPGVAEEADLALRAARLLRDRTGTGLGVDLAVTKRLPMGGGLGGGSSDAATTLVVLDRLWGLGLGPRRLSALGLELGADVPVFVHGHSAWAEGVGERLRPVAIEPAWFLVVTPRCRISTAQVFGHPSLTRDRVAVKMSDFTSGASSCRVALSPWALVARAGNDCEAVARRLEPEVDELLEWLGRRAPARMTGTGACVFALFGAEDEARRVQTELPDTWHGFVARGCDRSPLLAALARDAGAG